VHQFALPLMDCLLAPLPQPPSLSLSAAAGAAAASGGAGTAAAAEAAAGAAAAAAAGEGLCMAFTPQQLRLRRKAAAVLAALFVRARQQREALDAVEEAAALQLLRSLVHPSSSIETALGAAIGIRALGRKAVLLLLLPHASLLLHALERGQELAETQRLAISAKLVQSHSDAAKSSLLLLQQQVLDHRELLTRLLQDELLDAAFTELSEQLLEKELHASDGPEAALGHIFAVLEDAEEGLRDSYIPVVAAALRRAAAAAAAAAAVREASARCALLTHGERQRIRQQQQGFKQQQQQQGQQQQQQQQELRRQKEVKAFVEKIVALLTKMKQQAQMQQEHDQQHQLFTQPQQQQQQQQQQASFSSLGDISRCMGSALLEMVV
ncbi:hypothetical protein ETH_00031025, partial [Eimeria tenella]